MTELALILGIHGSALAYALLGVGRTIASPEAENARLVRLALAIERASSAFFLQGARVVALGALGASLALLLLQVVGSPESAPRLGVAHAALLSASSVGLGAALSLACAYWVLRSNLRASFQVALAAGTGGEHGLRVAVRSGGAASLFCEALSALGLLGAFGAVFTLAGGLALPEPEAIGLALEIVARLTGLPLGAALTALVLGRAAGTYRTAASLGAALAALGRAALPDDRRNPALVSGITGDHLVEGASRAALFFLIASASQVAMVALGLGLLATTTTPELGLLFLPLLARAFFVLASPFAFSVVRTEKFSHASLAVLRGQISALLIGLSGLLGSALWLTRGHAPQFFAAGVVSAFALGIATIPVWMRLLRRPGALREASEALPGSGGPIALSSLAAGLEATLVPISALGLGAVLVYQIGAHTEIASGGLWASLVGSGVLFGCAPFAFAVSSVGALAGAGSGAANLAALDAEARRGSEIEDETRIAAAGARAQLSAAGVATAMVCALSIPLFGRAPFSGKLVHESVTALRTDNLGLLEPVVTWCGALGVALVLAYTGSSARAGLRAAREVAEEVARQTEGLARHRGALELPHDFSPRYKSCVDLATRSGLHRLSAYAFGVVLIEALTALGLHLSYPSSTGPVALRGLASFVLFAAVTGFATALAIDAARTSLAALRAVDRSASERRPLSESAGFSDLLGGSAGPAAQAVLVAAAATGLALAPFLTN